MAYPVSPTFDLFDWSLAMSNLHLLSNSFNNPIVVTGPSKVYYDSTNSRWMMSSSSSRTALQIPIAMDTPTLEMTLIPGALPAKLSKANYVGFLICNPGGPSGGVMLSQEGIGLITQTAGGITSFERLDNTDTYVLSTMTLRMEFDTGLIRLYILAAGGGFIELASWYPYSSSGSEDYLLIDIVGSVDDPLMLGFSALRMGTDVDTSVPPTGVITGPSQAKLYEVIRVSGETSLNPTGGAMTYVWQFTTPTGSEAYLSGSSTASLAIGDATFTAQDYGDQGNLIRVKVVQPVGISDLYVAVSGNDITITLEHDGGGTYTTVTELVEALNNPTDSAYSRAMLDLIALTGSGDDPPPATAYTYLSGGVDSTSADPVFAPDVAGHYTLSLVVTVDGMSSAATTLAISVSEATLIYGAYPDVSVIRNQVAQPFFNMMAGNQYVEVMWRGVAHLVSNDILQTFQHRLNIHLDKAPTLYRSKWIQIPMYQELATPLEASWSVPEEALSGSLTPLDDYDGDTTTSKASCVLPSSFVGRRIGVLSPAFTATVTAVAGAQSTFSDSVIASSLIDQGSYGYTEGLSSIFLTKFLQFSTQVATGDYLYAMGVYKDVGIPASNYVSMLDTLDAPYPTAWKVLRPYTSAMDWHLLASVDTQEKLPDFFVGDVLDLEISYYDSETSQTYSGAARSRVFGISGTTYWFSIQDAYTTLRVGDEVVTAVSGANIEISGVNLITEYGVAEDWVVYNVTKNSSLARVAYLDNSSPTSFKDVVALKDDFDIECEVGDTLAFYSPVAWYFYSSTAKCTGAYRLSKTPLPDNALEIPVLRRSLLFEDPCYVMNEDYTISAGYVVFETPFTLTELPDKNLWAEHILYANVEAARIYGPFVGLPDLDEHPRSANLTHIAKALVSGAVTGPVKAIQERNLIAVSGAPFAPEECIITDVQGNNITTQDGDGRSRSFYTTTPDSFSVGQVIAKHGMLQDTVQIVDYLDSASGIYLLTYLGLVNNLDRYHAFIVNVQDMESGTEDMMARTLVRMKPAWQDALLVGQVIVEDDIIPDPTTLEDVDFVIKQLVADVPTSYEDPDQPVICGAAFMFDDPAHFSGTEYDDTAASGTATSAVMTLDAEASGVHKGWILLDITQSDYAWVTGVSGTTVFFSYGMMGGATPALGDVITLRPGYCATFGLTFNQLATHTALGGNLTSLDFDAVEMTRLSVGQGWRVHNLTTSCWGLISEIVGDTVVLTTNMEPVPPAPPAPNSLGDLFHFYPPSGMPGYNTNKTIYLGPMSHADYRVTEENMMGSFDFVGSGQAHREFVTAGSVIPPNYPMHPLSLLMPWPCLSEIPTVVGPLCSLSGYFFEPTLVVTFNGVPSPLVNVVAWNIAIATLPAGLTGDVDVRVENMAGAGFTWPAVFTV